MDNLSLPEKQVSKALQLLARAMEATLWHEHGQDNTLKNKFIEATLGTMRLQNELSKRNKDITLHNLQERMLT